MTHLHLDFDLDREYDEREPTPRERYEEALEDLGLDESAIDALWHANAPEDELRDAHEAGELVEHAREVYGVELARSV